jgi:BirA family transcriptional regulator, biotin operon repressor / biotin---[acetyl-CoA-carboxylase] ligase
VRLVTTHASVLPGRDSVHGGGGESGAVWSDLGRPPLRVAALRRGLVVPNGDYAALDVVAETGSTNADLVAAAMAGAPDRTVLVAEHQSAGRGRNSRSWHTAPRAGLSLSVLLRPGDDGVPNHRWGWLPLLAGLAVSTALRVTAEVDARLKWPNDVLIDGRKCAGILAEVADGAVVVGIGLNVSQRAAELPDGVAATSLAVEAAACTDRDPLLRSVLRELATLDRRWREHAGDPHAGDLRVTYLRACATVGQRVRVLLPAGTELTGEAVDIDEHGRLTVRDDHGTGHHVAAGDVIHVRGVAGPPPG